MKHPLVVLVVPVAAALFAVPACSDPPIPATCNDLAPPACPTEEDADVCVDVECASVYACNSGSWTFVQTCPNYSPEAGVHPVEAGPDTSSELDAPFDAPPGTYGGPGCVDLEMPDCSLGTALACAGTADCCGCTDLYVCDSGGWEPWGECVDGGITAGP
ncbi:MAG TPA: hypothetical protein VGL81_13150 [Polyangiaceae bacterium]|jgi:hypothetical protein